MFPAYPEWTFGCSGLDDSQVEEVKELANLLQAGFVEKYSKSVTHLILKTDSQNCAPRTEEYILALTQGSWILSSEWVKFALDEPITFIGKEMCSFEALDAETGKPGAQRTRRNRCAGEPRLLSGIELCLLGQPSQPSTVDRHLLDKIVKRSGGCMLRSPDLLQPVNSLLLVDKSFHLESHQHEVLSRMAASGVYPVNLDYLLDCICSHELLPTGGYVFKEAGGPHLEGSPKVAAVHPGLEEGCEDEVDQVEDGESWSEVEEGGSRNYSLTVKEWVCNSGGRGGGESDRNDEEGEAEESDSESKLLLREALRKEQYRKRKRRQSGDGSDGDQEVVTGKILVDILKRISPLC